MLKPDWNWIAALNLVNYSFKNRVFWGGGTPLSATIFKQMIEIFNHIVRKRYVVSFAAGG